MEVDKVHKKREKDVAGSVKKKGIGYFSQWSSTFYVAAELVRRKYLVSLTLGEAPGPDLLVISPNGKPFKVEVKSLRRHNFWLIGEVSPQDDLFYILVFVPEDVSQPPKFCILTSSELKREIDNYQKKLLAKGRRITKLEYGIPFRNAFKPEYENAWDKLPK
jgi:hypothetical protein